VKSRLTQIAITAAVITGALALSGGPASAASTSVSGVSSAQAQATLTPAQCSTIREEIEWLKSERALAQAELQDATPSQKSDLMREIRSRTAEIRSLAAQLVGCPA
jgi:hypothetical protein